MIIADFLFQPGTMEAGIGIKADPERSGNICLLSAFGRLNPPWC